RKSSPPTPRTSSRAPTPAPPATGWPRSRPPGPPASPPGRWPRPPSMPPRPMRTTGSSATCDRVACRDRRAAAKMRPAPGGGDAMPMSTFQRRLLSTAAAAAVLLAACRPLPPDAQAPAASDLSRPSLAVPLLAGFDSQFAGSAREIRAAATTMGMFGVQYVEYQGDFSDAERDHYAQLVTAVAQWAAQAPLADRDRAAAAIPRLAAAARAVGPASADDLAAAGMDASPQRIGAFSLEAPAALADYGPDPAR